MNILKLGIWLLNFSCLKDMCQKKFNEFVNVYCTFIFFEIKYKIQFFYLDKCHILAQKYKLGKYYYFRNSCFTTLSKLGKILSLWLLEEYLFYYFIWIRKNIIYHYFRNTCSTTSIDLLVCLLVCLSVCLYSIVGTNVSIRKEKLPKFENHFKWPSYPSYLN